MKRLRPEVIVPQGSASGIKYAIACVIAVMGLAAVDAGYQLAQVERQSQVEMAEAAARLQRSARMAETRRADERARRESLLPEGRPTVDGENAPAECPYVVQQRR